MTHFWDIFRWSLGLVLLGLCAAGLVHRLLKGGAR